MKTQMLGSIEDIPAAAAEVPDQASLKSQELRAAAPGGKMAVDAARQPFSKAPLQPSISRY